LLGKDGRIVSIPRRKRKPWHAVCADEFLIAFACYRVYCHSTELYVNVFPHCTGRHVLSAIHIFRFTFINKKAKSRNMAAYISAFHTLKNYVYWTVHHLDSLIKIDQLMSLALFFAQHVSNASTFIFRSLRLCVGILLRLRH